MRLTSVPTGVTFVYLLALPMLTACGGGGTPTEAQIQATVERCIARSAGKAPTTKGMTPELANNFLAAHNKMQRELCEKAVREICNRKPRECTAAF